MAFCVIGVVSAGSGPEQSVWSESDLTGCKTVGVRHWPGRTQSTQVVKNARTCGSMSKARNQLIDAKNKRMAQRRAEITTLKAGLAAVES